MPLPKPEANEMQDAFISRCMGDATMVSEYEDQARRAAVCHTQWRDAKGERKNLRAEFKAEASGERFVAVISTDTLDLDGEVLVPDGMDAGEFDKRRTVFWNHNYDRPIGVAVGHLRRGARSIESEVRFAERPATHEGEWFPDTVKALIGQGIVRGVSIGFRPIPGGVRTATDGDRRKYGADVQRIIHRWKLLEWSVAPFQCNVDAVVQATTKGMMTADAAKALFGVDPVAVAVPAPVVEPKPVRATVLVATPGILQPRVVVLMLGARAMPQIAKAVKVDIKAEVKRALAKALGRLYI